MMAYFLLYIVILLLCLLQHIARRHAVKQRGDFAQCSCSTKMYRCCEILLIGIAAVALIAMRGLRYGVGIDYFYTYVPRFTECLLNKTPSWGDWLYSCLMGISGSISPDFRFFFLLDSIIFITILLYSFYVLSSDTLLSILLFCVSYHFLRSFIFQAQYFALAFSVFSIALSFVFNKRRVAIVGILIASGFHSSVLVLLPAYIMCVQLYREPRVNNKTVVLVTLLLPFFTLVVRPFVPIIAEALLEGTRYSVYFGSRFSQDGPSWRLIFTNLAVLSFMIAVYSSQTANEERKLRFFLLMQSIAMSMSILTGAIPLLYRICLYPMIFQVISIPCFINTVKRRLYRNGLLALIVMCFVVVQFIYIAQEDGDGVFPYVSVFNTSSLPGDLRGLEREALGDYFWAIDALEYPDVGVTDLRKRF